MQALRGKRRENTEPTQEAVTKEELFQLNGNPRARACDSAKAQGRITQHTLTTRGAKQWRLSHNPEEIRMRELTHEVKPSSSLIIALPGTGAATYN
eukprot:2353313-Amphidinium_carterae.3